jgi:hypothetical protein
MQTEDRIQLAGYHVSINLKDPHEGSIEQAACVSKCFHPRPLAFRNFSMQAMTELANTIEHVEDDAIMHFAGRHLLADAPPRWLESNSLLVYSAAQHKSKLGICSGMFAHCHVPQPIFFHELCMCPE